MGLEYSTSEACLWSQQLEEYASRIQSLNNKPKLQSLDHFYTHTFPQLIKTRLPSPFITRHELSQVMEWKLTRGKWRPKLLSFVQSLDEKQVEEVSKKSFAALPDLEEAVTCLSTLKGVGPATASAVLAAVAPDIAPFMSDEAMMAVLGGVKEYTLKQYLLFADKLQSKSKELSTLTGKKFSPCDLERALWCAALERKFPKGGAKEEEQADKASDNPSAQSSNKKRKKRS